MALTVAWNSTQVIYVPLADLAPISGSLYELDVNSFRLELKSLESTEGMGYPDTHRHGTEITVGGVTLARSVEIINGYTVEFEDGQYTVQATGANHNLADVKVANQVSLITNNAAGLVVVESGVSGLTAQESADLSTVRKAVTNSKVVSDDTGSPLGGGYESTLVVLDDDDTTPLIVYDVSEDSDETQPYRNRGYNVQRKR